MPSNMAAKQILRIVENSKNRKFSPINDFTVDSVVRIDFDVRFVFLVLSMCNLIVKGKWVM